MIKILITVIIVTITGLLSNIVANWIEPSLVKWKRQTIIAFLCLAIGGGYFLYADSGETKVSIDHSTIQNSDIIISEKDLSVDNRTTIINNITNINTTYSITEEKMQDTIGYINLVSTDTNMIPKMYHGTETFVKCATRRSHWNFKFRNDIHETKKQLVFKIKWGDGIPDTIVNNFGPNSILSHTFPLGNSILQIEATDVHGRSQTKSYNVFIGGNPSIGLNHPGNPFNMCVNELYYINMTNFDHNPPWTVYKMSINDGSETRYFVNPREDSKWLPIKFSKTSLSSAPPKNKYGFKGSYFTVKLVAENPCGASLVSVEPFCVIKCKD